MSYVSPGFNTTKNINSKFIIDREKTSISMLSISRDGSGDSEDLSLDST